MMAYAAENDLYNMGDITFDENTRKRFIIEATRKIDVKLGFRYSLPLTPISSHVALILKEICIKLAMGMMVIDRALISEESTINAYGEYMMKEGDAILDAVAAGTLDLVGVTPATTQSTGSQAPAIIVGDTTSGVDAFYNWLNDPFPAPLGPGESVWRPGITT